MQKILFVLLSLLVLNACGTSAQLSSTPASQLCTFNFGETSIQWKELSEVRNIDLKSLSGSAKLPLEFEVYEVDSFLLDSFLLAAQQMKNSAKTIRFPLPMGCVSFSIVSSKLLSPELASKFPDLVSLKGTSQDQEDLSCRIDYHRGNLKVEFNHQGEIYFLDTWRGKTRSYYLTYKKENAGYEKLPFER